MSKKVLSTQSNLFTQLIDYPNTCSSHKRESRERCHSALANSMRIRLARGCLHSTSFHTTRAQRLLLANDGSTHVGMKNENGFLKNVCKTRHVYLHRDLHLFLHHRIRHGCSCQGGLASPPFLSPSTSNLFFEESPLPSPFARNWLKRKRRV